MPARSNPSGPEELSFPTAGECWPFASLRVSFQDLPGSELAAPADRLEPETCLFVMCLDGGMRLRMSGPESDCEISVPAGNVVLQYRPGSFRCTRCAEKRGLRSLEMSCPARELLRLLGGTDLGDELGAAVDQGRALHVRRPMSPATTRSLLTLRESVRTAEKGHGPLVLAKILETIWHFSQTGDHDPKARMPAETLRAVHKAKAILESRLDDPPDLGTLAAQVGLSLSRLKQVFPMACGMPPYAHLRVVRMERAMHLLRDAGRSVTETALEVGYSNLSHFSKTFAGHFGVQPSRVKGAKTP